MAGSPISSNSPTDHGLWAIYGKREGVCRKIRNRNDGRHSPARSWLLLICGHNACRGRDIATNIWLPSFFEGISHRGRSRSFCAVDLDIFAPRVWDGARAGIIDTQWCPPGKLNQLRVGPLQPQAWAGVSRTGWPSPRCPVPTPSGSCRGTRTNRGSMHERATTGPPVGVKVGLYRSPGLVEPMVDNSRRVSFSCPPVTTVPCKRLPSRW